MTTQAIDAPFQRIGGYDYRVGADYRPRKGNGHTRRFLGLHYHDHCGMVVHCIYPDLEWDGVRGIALETWARWAGDEVVR